MKCSSKRNNRVIGFGENTNIKYYVMAWMYLELLLMPKNKIRENEIKFGLAGIARVINRLCGKKVCSSYSVGIKWNYLK